MSSRASAIRIEVERERPRDRDGRYGPARLFNPTPANCSTTYDRLIPVTILVFSLTESCRLATFCERTVSAGK
jgi:hypothetical protein